MRLSRIQIENFRNFKKLDIAVGEHAIIVGENKVGKTNLLHALRLLLDPTLPESSRQLREDDFWDGLPRPLTKKDRIEISVEITDFESNPNLLALLAEHLVQAEPMVAKLTYLFRPLPVLEGDPTKEADFEFITYGAGRLDNGISYELRRRLPLDVLPALRDAEDDLSNWRRSPLRPLLDEAISNVSKERIDEIADEVATASQSILELPEIETLEQNISKRLEDMVGDKHAVDVSLSLTPTDPGRLFRGLRPFIDGGKRGIGEASLGSANLVYLALKSLELNQFVEQGNRDHTFLAIEEPEAHLHPHLQRLVYRDYLQQRMAVGSDDAVDTNKTVILTTHSPNIVSVTPVKSLVLLKVLNKADGTSGFSTANLSLAEKDIADLERYLDVSRGEIVFSRGVLLVEGDAECFLLPTLAKLNGYDLDELGITVCSVGGINFAPYIKLLGKAALNIPFAVITDYDPTEDGRGLGEARIEGLLTEVLGVPSSSLENGSKLYEIAKAHGLFLNEYTLEIDLFKSGRRKSMCTTLKELTLNSAAIKRADDWIIDNATLDEKRFLHDIEAIGKGRFAQRLSTKLKGTNCPRYILDAVKFVADRCC